MNEMQVSFTGTVSRDASIYTPQNGGKRSLNFGVAHSARQKHGEEYVDTETMFVDCSVWERFIGDPQLDNLARILVKGSRVHLVGGLYAEKWTSREGREGVSNKLKVQSVGLSAEWHEIAAPVKRERGGQQGYGQQQAQGGWGQPQQQAQQGSPWGGQQAQSAWGQPAGQPAQQQPAQQTPPAAAAQPPAQQMPQPQQTLWGESPAGQADDFGQAPF